MIVENWRVALQNLPGRFDKALYIYRKHGDKLEYITAQGLATTVDTGADITPVLTLNEEMLYALAEELSGKDYKPKDLGKVEGLYEAQSDHLADLRHLLKLPPPIITISGKKHD